MKWYEDPIYIKMSKKAEEIQKLRKKWQWGDFYCETPIELLNKGKPPSISLALSIDNKRYKNEIWLPRQDDLQEMLKKWLKLYIKMEKLQYSYLWNLWLDFSSFVMNEQYFGDKNVTDIFTSMEQIWFTFVMKKKYNKVWNGKEWIKTKQKGIIRKYDFRVFEGRECPKVLGEEEHNLCCDTDGERYWEYCYRCGKAWNLTKKEAINIWGIGNKGDKIRN